MKDLLTKHWNEICGGLRPFAARLSEDPDEAIQEAVQIILRKKSLHFVTLHDLKVYLKGTVRRQSRNRKRSQNRDRDKLISFGRSLRDRTQSSPLEFWQAVENLYDKSDRSLFLLEGDCIRRCSAGCHDLFRTSKIVDSRPYDPQLSPLMQEHGQRSSVLARWHIGRAMATGCDRFSWLHEADGQPIRCHIELHSIPIWRECVVAIISPQAA